MSIYHYLSLILGLIFIRMTGFFVCLPNNFDNIWKPGSFSSFSTTTYILLSLIFIATLVCFVKKLGKSNNKVKNSFFLFFLFIYFSYLLFNRTIETDTLDYLLLLHYSSSPLNDIVPNLILDCFFEPPYFIWGLTFMGIIYFICKKYNHIEYSFYFWIIPFALVQYCFNDLATTLIVSYCIMAMLGMKYAEKISSLLILTILFTINLASVIYAFYLAKLNINFFIIAIETILLFFLPSFLITFICKKSDNKNGTALTWIVIPVTLFFLNLPLNRLQTGICLAYFIDFISIFSFAGNIVLLFPLLFCIVYITKLLLKPITKIIFYFISVFIIIFYILDIALYYYSQFRINYQTLVWTQTMNDIAGTTLATCFNYLSPLSIVIAGLTFIAALLILFRGKEILSKNKHFRFNYVFILLVSQFSIAILQMSDPLPEVYKDPVVELIKSMPFSDYFKKTIPIEKIEKGFIDCGLPLKKIPETAIDNSNTNKTNLIIITLESVHWRYLNIFGKNQVTWPLMSRFKDRMEIFPFIYSSFPDSTSCDFAVLTGLIPYDHLYLHRNPNIRHKTIVHELKKYNYNTSLFSSESLNDGGLNNLLKFLPFDYTFSFYSKDRDDNNTWEWGYKEEYTTKKIIDYLKNNNSNKPFFVWYRTVYPHAPFTLFKPDNAYLYQEKENNGLLTLVAKYKNSLTYLDEVLYNFINEITELDKKNNQKTLIVMIGDHGEKLKEKDFNYTTGHGLNTTPDLQNVACIFIMPESEGIKINNNFGSQADILPTVMDYLNLSPSVERYEQGESLYKEKNRPIYLSSFKSYALIEDGYFFEFRDKNSPNFRVTKLNFSNEILKPTYEKLSNWPNHKEIFEKYNRVKTFFKLQEEFLNQLK